MARSKAQAAALRQVLLAATAKYADKEFERDQLAEGSKLAVGVSLLGTIDGKQISDEFEGTLTVGFNQESASSSACSTPELLAVLIERYVDGDRQAKVFDELPALFDKCGGKLPIEQLKEPALVERCDALVKKLRAKTTITRKGNVTLNYTRGEA